MRFLLDTNAVIALLKGDPGMISRLRQNAPADFGLSSIVCYELLYGAAKSARREANEARVHALRFEHVPFDDRDAWHAGAIRAGLERAGTPIGAYDLLIAGQAVARDLILITRNTREFERIDGLAFEDWEG